MRSELVPVDMSDRLFAEVTSEVRRFAGEEGDDGLVNVFVPHATAAVVLMETGSGSESDLEDALNRLLPRDHRYTHGHGSPGHGADHLVPGFLGSSVTIPVVGGDLQLGTWQSVVLVDFNEDNPQRRVRLSFLSG